MITATLGGLIKDYRIKKRLSQVDVSLRMGWKDTSRISKIEQGRVGKPNRQTAERIIAALELNEQERGNFLLAGGYLPSDDEIQNIVAEVTETIDKWPYAAFLMDFSFRWLYANKGTFSAMKIPYEKKDWVMKTKPNFLMFPFLPKGQVLVEINKGEDKDNLKSFPIAQIATFKNENEKYQNESWYKKLIKDLMQFEDFRKMWPNVDKTMYSKKLFDYEYKTITGNYNGKEIVLRLHLSTAKVIKDPRFQIVFCFPADKKTEEFFTSF